MLGFLCFPSNHHAVSNFFFTSLIVFQPIPDPEMKIINFVVAIHYLLSFSFSKCLALEWVAEGNDWSLVVQAGGNCQEAFINIGRKGDALDTVLCYSLQEPQSVLGLYLCSAMLLFIE